MIYYNTNFCKIRYRAKSLRLETTFTITTVLEGKLNLFLYYKNANFLNFRPTFKAQAF